jgi:hypothetical protein
LSIASKSVGYDFFGWFEGEERLSGEAAYSFTMNTKERDIEARFYKVFESGKGITYDADAALLPSSGEGTLSDPYVYEVSTKEQFALAAYRLNEKGYYSREEGISGSNLFEKFVLLNDINLCGAEWTPIKLNINQIFDGKGYEIANFKINIDTQETTMIYAGLFGEVGGAEIKNLKVSGAEITIAALNSEKIYVGAVAGRTDGALLENLTVVGGKLNIKGSSVYAGMIVGEIANPQGGNVSGLHAIDKITGKTTSESGVVRVEASVKGYVGGLAGYFGVGGNSVGTSSSTAKVYKVDITTTYAGSIFGGCKNNVNLSGATATGTVNGKNGEKAGILE